MKQRALTILEVVIATAILVVVGLIMVTVMTFGLQQMTRAKALHIAASLAQQKMEEAIEIAPNKLSNLNGNFTEQPDYSYQVIYTPTSQAPDFLQTVLVKVLGPFSTQTSYAAAVTSASGYSAIASSEFQCNDISSVYFSSPVLAVLDKSAKKVYIRQGNQPTCKMTLDFSGATSRIFTSIRIGGINCDSGNAYYRLYLIDRSTSPFTICALDRAVSFGFNYSFSLPAECSYTSPDLSSLLTCSSFSNFFVP